MLKIVPLGGLGEVGMNTMALEHAGERLLIDCGLMFPRDNQLGVDVVLPDFEWLKAAPDALQGIVLTHAHEDHLGALPWLLREIKVPVYGTPFTLALARHRLEEAGLTAELREIAPGEPFQLGQSFQVEPIRVAHSVPDAVGLAIQTPSALAVHTGDFKLDGFPIDGHQTDLRRLGELGERGVSVLLSDSTNAEVTGWTGSEKLVQETMGRLLSTVIGRCVIALFGSHLHRVRHLIELARQTSRKVILMGRSLERNVELAQTTGLLERYEDVLVPWDAASSLPASQTMVICTGAQGEPRAALTQLLSTEPGRLRLEPHDTAIISARTIPGNEPAVSNLINRMLARGVRVITSREEPGIHVSGHAAREEQRRVLETVRPQQFIPIHGELRHLHQHLRLAQETGLSDRQLFLATDGDVVGVDHDGARTLGRVPAGRHLMRREGLTPLTQTTIDERRWIAESGVVMAVTVLQLGSGRILKGPLLQGLGLQSEELAALSLATESARNTLEQLSEAVRSDDGRIREEIIRSVRRIYKQLLGTRPTVVSSVIRIP